MKLLLGLIVGAAAYGQSLDLSGLDRLIPLASQHSLINMDAEKLRSGLGMITSDEDSVKALSNMKALQVLELKFDKDGVYGPTDLELITRQMAGKGWSKIIDVKEKGESTQMFLRSSEGKGQGGMVIISAEPRQLTVVNIAGNVDLSAMGLLKGKIPHLSSGDGKPGTKKPGAASKDEE